MNLTKETQKLKDADDKVKYLDALKELGIEVYYDDEN